MTETELQDAELLDWLMAEHNRYHVDLARRVGTKKYAKSLPVGGVERTRQYLAGDPAEQAADEYRAIMRFPAAWAHFRAKTAEEAVHALPAQAHALCFDSQERCRQDPVGEARSKFNYAKMRAEMGGAYGMAGTGDRPAAELWANLTKSVQEDPALPETSAPRP